MACRDEPTGIGIHHGVPNAVQGLVRLAMDICDTRRILSPLGVDWELESAGLCLSRLAKRRVLGLYHSSGGVDRRACASRRMP